MNVSDDELRALVREAIAKHDRTLRGAPSSEGVVRLVLADASHLRFALPQGGDGDGTCLIEPAVRCNHCGFCQSFGH
jgi:hypothetical protein